MSVCTFALRSKYACMHEQCSGLNTWPIIAKCEGNNQSKLSQTTLNQTTGTKNTESEIGRSHKTFVGRPSFTYNCEKRIRAKLKAVVGLKLVGAAAAFLQIIIWKHSRCFLPISLVYYYFPNISVSFVCLTSRWSVWE